VAAHVRYFDLRLVR
jgi:hypothetical protein